MVAWGDNLFTNNGIYEQTEQHLRTFIVTFVVVFKKEFQNRIK